MERIFLRYPCNWYSSNFLISAVLIYFITSPSPVFAKILKNRGTDNLIADTPKNGTVCQSTDHLIIDDKCMDTSILRRWFIFFTIWTIFTNSIGWLEYWKLSPVLIYRYGIFNGLSTIRHLFLMIKSFGLLQLGMFIVYGLFMVVSILFARGVKYFKINHKDDENLFESNEI